MADSAGTRAAKWVYTILGLLMVLSASYVLYSKLERPVAGVLIFMVGILALYFYYVKWFVIPEAMPAWPPFQTPCPDYLTLVSTPGSGPNAPPVNKCVDFVGVSKNGRILKADPRQLQTQLNDPRYYIQIDPNAKEDELKAMTASYGLTWTSLFGDV